MFWINVSLKGSALQVMNNMFESIHVTRMRIVHVETNLLAFIRDVETGEGKVLKCAG